ncbi:MAG TPA: DivIVA domain-containing protein [Actinomadura sp.]|jgi:DivIVA domain-containing protein|nr:DivIVA domain-containing protein [Actinomadura sp.]
MPLTPADVRNKQFSTTRLRPGYDEEEVDAFLDDVEAELDRLIQENEELRAKLAESLRGKVPTMAAPIVEPKPDITSLPEHSRPEPEPEPMRGLSTQLSTEDNMDTAARVLALAQQTADQAIADARREADETLGRARREAEEIIGKARRQADQVVGEARARAESLDRDAQDRHRQVMGTLVQQREELEREVDHLRAFEREYRSRLKLYLEGQLRDLEAGGNEVGAFTPSVTSMGQQTGPQTAPQSPIQHVDMRNGQPSGGPSATGPTPFPPPPAELPQHIQHTPTGAFHGAGDTSPHERR